MSIQRTCCANFYFSYVILLTFIGPEYLGRNFEVSHDSDMEEAAGHETIMKAIHRREAMGMGISESDQEDIDRVEKGHARPAE
jgi:SHS family lactate transporter-like MFS transporter